MDTNDTDYTGPNPSVPAPNPAVDLIRQKITSLYQEEPDASLELADAAAAPTVQSKHQKFMYDLSNSGKSLAEIQVGWHDYYLNLSDDEKHEVWQEFYEQHGKTSEYFKKISKPTPEITRLEQANSTVELPEAMHGGSDKDPRTYSDVQKDLSRNINTRSKTTKRQHLQSLLFGLSMGAIVVLILLFGFFNERFIAPFISPSRNVSSTPIINDTSTIASGPEPKVIIPKINVEAPVVFDEPSIQEKEVQKALERGVLHYATTPNPGELGNGVLFGHSSSNILNRGKYKFAFVLLNRMEIGDTFMVQKDNKRYTYKIYEKKVVKPTEVSVLNAKDKKATFTLITCDPPGTSVNRLVVVGEQISPDPNSNVASSAAATQTQTSVLPSNAPSLWQRLIEAL